MFARMKRFGVVALVAVVGLLATSPAFATDPVVTIPDAMKPESIANSAMTILAPLVTVIITVSLTIWAGVLVYKVIRRRVSGVGR